MRTEILSNLKAALVSVGNAQENIDPNRVEAQLSGKGSLALWDELGKLYDQIDGIITSWEDGDYD